MIELVDDLFELLADCGVFFNAGSELVEEGGVNHWWCHFECFGGVSFLVLLFVSLLGLVIMSEFVIEILCLAGV